MTDEEEFVALEKYYETNEQKMNDAGNRRMYYCESCIGCKYFEEVGPTFADIDDPIIHGICHHKELQSKSNCKGREELT